MKFIIIKSGLFLNLFLTVFLGVAQDPYYIHYTNRDGLPSLETFKVFQDSKGFIWVATNNGVSRFDGYEFENFGIEDGLPDNTVLYIKEDVTGKIWFFPLSNKIFYYDNNKMQLFKRNDILHKTIPERFIRKVFYDLNDKDTSVTILLGRNPTFLITKQQDFRVIKKEDNVPEYLIINDKITKVLFKKQYVPLTIKIDKKIIDQYMRYLNDSIFSYGKTLFVKIGNQFHVYFHESKIINISRIGDELWVGLNENGIDKYIFNDDSLIFIKKFLPQKSVSGVMRDVENGMWFTTLHNGMFYSPCIEILTFVNDSDNYVTAITGNNKSIWFSTSKGHLFNCKNNTVFPIEVPETGTYISSIFYEHSENNLWIGGYARYLYEYTNGRIKKILNPLLISTNNKFAIKTIFVDSNRIMVGCSKGLQILDKNNRTVYESRMQDNCSVKVNSILKIKKDSFLLATNAGLFYYKKKMKLIYQDDSLLQIRLKKVKKYKDFLLLASKGYGLIVLWNNDIFQLTKDDGLLSNVINDIEIDKDKIWIATNKGISNFRLKMENNNLVLKSINNFSYLKAVLHREVNDIFLHEHNISLATSTGMITFNDSNLISSRVPFPVYFKYLQVNNKRYEIKDTVNLKYDENNIDIYYTSLDFKKDGDITYSFQLSGSEKIWHQTNDNHIRYFGLPPGEYVFKIFNIENKKISKFIIIIRPPFWMTWWFYTLIIIILAFVIAALYYVIYQIKMNAQKKLFALKEKELHKQNKIKEQMLSYRHQALTQQMNPHFIFNTLTSIQNFIIKNDVKASNKYLTKFSKLMRLILTTARNERLLLDEELKILELYMALEQLRTNSKFTYEFKIDEQLKSTLIFIYPFLVQPFIENAIWHGIIHKDGKGKIVVEVIDDDEGIIFKVMDSGVGRRKAAEIENRKNKLHQSFATEIVRDRLLLFGEKLGGNFFLKFEDVFTENHTIAGTLVTIRIPKLFDKL